MPSSKNKAGHDITHANNMLEAAFMRNGVHYTYSKGYIFRDISASFSVDEGVFSTAIGFPRSDLQRYIGATALTKTCGLIQFPVCDVNTENDAIGVLRW